MKCHVNNLNLTTSLNRLPDHGSFRPQSSPLDLISAGLFLSCSAAEEVGTRAVLDQLNLGNLFPYMIYAKAHMFSPLLSGTVAYCRRLFRTVKRPHLFGDEQDPFCEIERPLAEFQECLNTLEDNHLAFYLILGWVEFAPSDRLVHLKGLLDAFVTVEILNLDGFASELYSFDVPDLDRCGNSPDESCETRSTWPKMTLVCTRATDHQKRRNDGGVWWFRKGGAKWSRFAPYPGKLASERYTSDVCLWKDVIYVMGGYTTEIWTLNIRTFEWKVLSQHMSTARLRPAIAAFEGKIYAFGGFTERSRAATRTSGDLLDSAECFDLATRKWTMLTPMDTPMQGAKAFVHDRKIYIVGGSASKHHRTASRRVLTFDPASEAYEAVTDIPECIVDFGVVVVGSVMYLVGGYTVGGNHSELTNSFLGFDLCRREWLKSLPALNCARKSCACFYDGRTIWVIGGHDPVNLNYSNSVERLDIDDEYEWRWETVDNFPFGAALDVIQCPMPASLMCKSHGSENDRVTRKTRRGRKTK